MILRTSQLLAVKATREGSVIRSLIVVRLKEGQPFAEMPAADLFVAK